MDLYNILYNFVINYGYLAIFLISVLESIILPIPPDIFIALSTSLGLNPILSALVSTLGNTIGGLIAYYLGYKFGEPLVIKLFGKENFEKGKKYFDKYGLWGIVIAGFTPIPYKIFAWLSGIFEVNIYLFVLATIIGKLPRHLISAYLGKILS